MIMRRIVNLIMEVLLSRKTGLDFNLTLSKSQDKLIRALVHNEI